MCPIPQALHRCCVALLLTGSLASMLLCHSSQAQPQNTQDEALLPRPRTDVPIRFNRLTVYDGLSNSVVQAILQSEDPDYGYNAATDKYENLLTSGVIDPTKVACAALQNAASVATLLLTTEALVSVVPEKKGKKGGEEMDDMDF